MRSYLTACERIRINLRVDHRHIGAGKISAHACFLDIVSEAEFIEGIRQSGAILARNGLGIVQYAVYINFLLLVFVIIHRNDMNKLRIRGGLLSICSCVILISRDAGDEIRLSGLILGNAPAAGLLYRR